MDTLSAAALMQCEGDWVSLDGVAAGVVADLDLQQSPSLTNTLLPLLHQFTNLGLLEQDS